MVTATQAAKEAVEQERDERTLHSAMEWFFKKWSPDYKDEAAEFHADLIRVVQAVHRDASRETHKLLEHAIALMPNPFTLLQKSEPK